MPTPLPVSERTTTDQLPGHVQLPDGWCDLNIAVALSGGADSVSLLCVLRHLKQQHGGSGRLLALHIDHQLRGVESAADAQWCREFCESLSVPLEVVTCDTAQLAMESGDGIEAAARAERYRLLTAAAERDGIRYLATAHTRDDQVETVLFRVLRGTGLRGLAGIPRSRALTPSLTLVRPLLDCSREMVVSYLSELGQTYRTDGSNTDRQFARNRLRHDLLPLLREHYNPEVEAALLRLAAQAGDAQQVVEFHARRLLEATRHDAKGQAVAFRCSAFSDQSITVIREALRIAWREASLPEQAMTYEWWNKLAELAVHSTEGRVLNLPGNVRASVVGGLLLLEK